VTSTKFKQLIQEYRSATDKGWVFTSEQMRTLLDSIGQALTYEEAVAKIDNLTKIAGDGQVYDDDLGDAIHHVLDAVYGKGPLDIRDFVRAAMFSMPTEFLEAVIQAVRGSRRHHKKRPGLRDDG
jgi:hypothetical protein